MARGYWGASRNRRTALIAIALAFAVGALSPVFAADRLLPVDLQASFVRHLEALMSGLREESVSDAARIRIAYERAVSAALPDRAALAAALSARVVRRLPVGVTRLNVRVRLHGPRPIGEKDLDHQSLYVAARPETLGCLLHVAAAVRSAPLDVTSLVRHHEYQRVLLRTNPNARTGFPTHAAGLAFDISVLNVPLTTAAETRDRLREMRDAGYLYFVAESRQLVFHVVPRPEWSAFYAELFDALISLPPPRPARAAPSPQALLARAGLHAQPAEVGTASVWWMVAAATGLVWMFSLGRRGAATGRSMAACTRSGERRHMQRPVGRSLAQFD
jgi:hypothetical protein